MAAATAAAALVAGVVMLSQSATAADPVTFTPVADTYVQSDQTGTSFGTSTQLRVDGSPLVHTYVRFNVTGVTGIVTSAKLRLFANSAQSIGYNVHNVSSDTWSESITWNTKPAMTSTIVDSSGPVTAGTWTEVDVTSLVTGNGLHSFGVDSVSNTALSLSSREGANDPELIITTESVTPQPEGTIRAAFYYPWFPEAWDQQGIFPFTKYHPTLGFYDLDDGNVTIGKHVDAMKYGNIQAGISSWWGPGDNTDDRLDNLLDVGLSKGFFWTVYYEDEAALNPSASAITADLQYLKTNYIDGPDGASWLRKDGKPVIFVYAGSGDGCSMATRWKQGNTLGFYVVLKVFTGYRNCADQPDSWHQYAPAQTDGADEQDGYSYAISPGFWLTSESSPRFTRSLSLWQSNVVAMAASDEPWQLVTTFNEWGENTSVEEATEWATGPQGDYLEALHNSPVEGGTPPPPPPPPPGDTFVAAGDIACEPPFSVTSSSCHHGAVGDLIEQINPVAVLIPGDIQYERGELADFNASYHPAWGSFKSKTYPVPGNHEYNDPSATSTNKAPGYWDYFGSRAHTRNKGWYSFDLGEWHFVALNSQCSSHDGCNNGDEMYEWLEQDLAANDSLCTVAFFHHPRFSSGDHGNDIGKTQLWNLLAANDVDIVIAGHDHHYERFAPSGGGITTSTVNPPSDPNGIRHWVVGTGGKNHRPTGTPLVGSVVRDSTTWGVLKVTMGNGNYTYQFVRETTAGNGSFTDSGSGTCH